MAVTRDPALVWSPLSEHASQALITPYQWIVHTAVDAPGSTDLGSYFENHTSLESHTWLRFGGRHEQLMDLNRRADANYKANQFWVDGKSVGAVSTETEDDGTPVERPWDKAQLAELIRFGVWLNKTFGIPPYLPTAWNAPGMGYHSLYPGVWSNVAGKTCPGSTRIDQFKNEVLPGIRKALAAPEPAEPVQEDDDMPNAKPLLLRLTAKDPAVIYMSVDRTARWVQNPEALQGYKLDMQMNGLSPDVCVLSAIEDDKGQLDELYDFVVSLPWIGPFPPHWVKAGAVNPWAGPVIATE